MKQIKFVVLIAALVLVVSFAIPSILVLPFSSEKANGKLTENLENPKISKLPAVEVAVYRNNTKKIESLPLEQYVVGVVAAEMPATFEEEALKAQALAARTFIVRHLVNGSGPDVPKGANVTDTIMDQVYLDNDELRKEWDKDYNRNLKKITKAVKATEGKILTYNGQPIDAMFFSTSNGFTENSEDYWANAIPYLKSVTSPWDKKSPKFHNQTIKTVQEFEKELGVKISNNRNIGTIISKTKGNRVAKVNISGKKFTGREVREKLGLKSTDFSWERKGDKIVITTEGNGHGVGMSQYGANGMAQEGKNYLDIVKHYYQGVQVATADPFLKKVVTAKR